MEVMAARFKERPKLNETLGKDMQADVKAEGINFLEDSLSYLRKEMSERVRNTKTKDEDLYNIAKFAYGWYGENCRIIFKPVSGAECELRTLLNQHDIYKLTGSLTLILTMYSIHNTYKFIPLVICRQNCEIVAYYTYFECGHFEKRNRLFHQLKKLIPGVRILTFENLSKYWPLYDLVFAFEDARIINEALQSSQSEQIEQKLASYNPTLEQMEQKLAEYVNALIVAYPETLDPKMGSLEGLLFTIETVCANLAAYVISENLDVNEKYIGGWTPLLLAVRSGRMNLVENLIDRGANVNYVSFDLLLEDQVDIINVIISEGAEVTPDHVTIDRNMFFFGFDRAYAFVVSLSRHHTSIKNALFGFAKYIALTPLTLAISHGYADIANYLVKLDADNKVNVKYNSSKHMSYDNNYYFDEVKYHEANLVYMAFIGYHTDIIDALLNRKKLDSDEKYEELLCSSLIFAVWKGNLEVATALIDRGANINDHENLLPFVFNGFWRILEVLMGLGVHMNGDDEELLQLAVEENYQDMLCLLINQGATLEKMSKLLTYAALLNRGEIIEILLDEGVDVDVINEDESESALLVAVKNGRIISVITLINRGADLNLLVEDGLIPVNQMIRDKEVYQEDEGRRVLINIEREIIKLIVNRIAKLRAADLYSDECSSRILQSIYCTVDGLNADRIYEESLKAYRIEIEKLSRENKSLYVFLKETNTNELLNLWEEVADKFDVYSNDEYWDMGNHYPQYADILMNKANKANELGKEIFVHNNKQLIDALSTYYKRDIRKMDLTVLKNFIKKRRDEIVANFAKMEFPLTDFVNFGVTKKTVPRLDMIAFARAFGDMVLDGNADIARMEQISKGINDVVVLFEKE